MYRVLLNAARDELKEDPHEVVSSFAQISLAQLAVEGIDHVREAGKLEEHEEDELTAQVLP